MAPGFETFLYALGGDASLLVDGRELRLDAGGFAYLPATASYKLFAGELPARLLLVKRRYEPAPGLAAPRAALRAPRRRAVRRHARPRLPPPRAAARRRPGVRLRDEPARLRRRRRPRQHRGPRRGARPLHDRGRRRSTSSTASCSRSRRATSSTWRPTAPRASRPPAASPRSTCSTRTPGATGSDRSPGVYARAAGRGGVAPEGRHRRVRRAGMLARAGRSALTLSAPDATRLGSPADRVRDAHRRRPDRSR